MGLRIADDEREVVARETAALMESLPDGPARVPYRDLLAALHEGEVPEPLLEPLSRVLELSLESGRLRRLHGPHAEMAALRLFQRTPGGRRLREAAEEVNGALARLAGQTLQEVGLAARGPGAWALSLETDRCRIQLLIDRWGVRIQSLEMGV